MLRLKKRHISVTNKQLKMATILFLVVSICAFVFYLTAASFIYQEMDLFSFNLPWAVAGAKDGIFSIYQFNDPAPDYPPVCLFLISLFGGPLEHFAINGSWQGVMFLLKFWPIVFDVLLAVVVFFSLRKESLILALFGGAFWLVNPAALVNCVWWGQTDCLFCFLLFLTVWFFYRRKPELALVFFAIGCLTKLQMCYLAPIVLCELFFYYPVKRAFCSLGGGITVGILGWLPFMIGSGSFTLPFEIYFGGFVKYPYMTLYAANSYGIFCGADDWFEVNWPLFGNITVAQFSTFLLGLIIVCVFVWYLLQRKTGIRLEMAVIAMVYLNFIFLFTTGQHERYQIPVMLLVFVWYLIAPKISNLVLYLCLTVVIFCNQIFVLLSVNYDMIFVGADLVFRILSVFNVLGFVFMIFLVACEFLQKKKHKLAQNSGE